MNDLPKRKSIRIEDFDYSTPGAYFITVCTAKKEKLFWSDRRGNQAVQRDNYKAGRQAHLAKVLL